MITGWSHPKPVVTLAALTLRAALETRAEISSEALVRPLVTQTIQHLAQPGQQVWIAPEFERLLGGDDTDPRREGPTGSNKSTHS